MQLAHDGALAFDGLAHALRLAGKGLAPSLVAQQLAFFGVCLLELDALALAAPTSLTPAVFDNLLSMGVGDGFLLYGGVDNDSAEFFAGNQLQGHGNLYRSGQEFLDAFFAQQFTELDQLGRVARPAVLNIFDARKVLPSGGLTPALD